MLSPLFTKQSQNNRIPSLSVNKQQKHFSRYVALLHLSSRNVIQLMENHLVVVLIVSGKFYLLFG